MVYYHLFSKMSAVVVFR